MEGFSLHFTYFVRDTKRKHLFFKEKNKHWKNLLVLIMWKKNKTKQENPFSGVVRIVSTPHFSPSFSWFLCIALHWALPCPFLWANSGLFIVLLYNEPFINCPWKTKQVYKVETKCFATNSWTASRIWTQTSWKHRRSGRDGTPVSPSMTEQVCKSIDAPRTRAVCQLLWKLHGWPYTEKAC